MTEIEMLQRAYFSAAGCLDAPVDDDGERVVAIMGHLVDPWHATTTAGSGDVRSAR